MDTDADASEGVYFGHTEAADDVDWIAIELQAGVTYTFRLAGRATDNGTIEDPEILGVFDANGDQIAAGDSDSAGFLESLLEFTPATTGTYYVSVTGYFDDIGSYTLYVTRNVSGDDGDNGLVGSNTSDSLNGGIGNDTIDGGAGNDYLRGGLGDDLLTGGAGSDLFEFPANNWDAVLDDDAELWGDDTISDFDPSEDILDFGDRIIGSLDDFTISEDGGNTVLTTDWGDSVTLIGVSASALSADNFAFRAGPLLVPGNIEGDADDETLTGGEDADTIYGYGGNDVIRGGDGADYLRGFEGNDSLVGGAGNDIIGGEGGDNTLEGGAGDDFLVAHDGNDHMAGGDGDDLLESRSGDDVLLGGSGNDTLRPGQGDDSMNGGAGADIFVIGRGWGDDTISDFELAADTLDFRGSGLDIADLTFEDDGDNVVISDGANSLTIIGLSAAELEPVAEDVILEPGNVTSFYTDFHLSETVATPDDGSFLDNSDVIVEGARWTRDSDGVTTTVSYSFANAEFLFPTTPQNEDFWSSVAAITPLTQWYVEQSIAQAEAVSNIDLVWVEDNGTSAGQIRFTFSTFVSGGASTVPFDGPGAGTVLVGVGVGELNAALFFTHELGHSFGFSDLDTATDFVGEDTTVMAYVPSSRYQDAEYTTVSPTQYMYADILGLQFLYGVDTITTAGQDEYLFDLSKAQIATVWDYGGDDTLGVYGSGDAVHINLTPGSWSNIGPDITYSGNGTSWIEPGTIFITPDTIIENAYGADGDDTLTGNDADNRLMGNVGADTLLGMTGDDILVGGEGADRLDGGEGADTASYESSSAAVTVTLGVSAAGGDAEGDSLVSIENVMGSAYADWLTGDNTANALSGGRGADTLNGGEGDDVLFGGTQADRLDGGAGNDSLLGGNGNDTVEGGSGSDTLSGSIGDDSLNGGSQGDRLFGDSGADTLNGGGGSDRVDYLIGDDAILVDLETGEATGGFADGDVLMSIESLFGGKGDDTLRALEAGSRLNGAGGDDFVTGRSGNDLLAGGNGNDVVTGGAGDDLMNGNRGDDTLDGGAGDDTLRGSAGSDTFIFSEGTGDDIVLDFRANDLLDLSNTATDFTSLADVQAAATETEAGLLIDLGGGDSVLLIGHSLSILSTDVLIL